MLIGVGVVLFCCSEDSIKPQPFSFEKAEGIWVPYEIENADNTINTGPFTANGIFGSYSESFQLKVDQTFIPLSWTNKDVIAFSSLESGTCNYSENTQKLIFHGVWELNFNIVKFEKDDLWLKDSNKLIKFKRQL